MNNNKTHTKNGITFIPVPQIDNGFSGAPSNMFFKRDELPNVPAKYTKMANSLFFNGGRMPEFIDGVDRDAAFNALSGWLKSWDVPHESKITTVAYALWVWCEGVMG